jgi:hypothetical protein
VQDFHAHQADQLAVLSPSKVMIGKNVMVEGDLGATYSDVAQHTATPDASSRTSGAWSRRWMRS